MFLNRLLQCFKKDTRGQKLLTASQSQASRSGDAEPCMSLAQVWAVFSVRLTGPVGLLCMDRPHPTWCFGSFCTVALETGPPSPD